MTTFLAPDDDPAAATGPALGSHSSQAEPNAAPTPAATGTWTLKGQLVAGGTMQRMQLASMPFTVGRSGEVSLMLSHPTVSSRHSELFLAAGTLMVRDLESRNGTFLNGHPVTTPQPVRSGDIVQFAELAFLVEYAPPRTTQNLSMTMAGATVSADVQDQSLAVMQFEKLMSSRAIVPHYQPIVDLEDRRAMGYELLGRSRLMGLQSPGQMFKAAAQFDQEVELSRLLRTVGIGKSPLPEGVPLFVNTHPLEVGSEELIESLMGLRKMAPDARVVLEIHEAAVANPTRLLELRRFLDDLDMQLAYDDFGAGQTRLRELVDVRPDYLKFDMGLIRDLDTADDAKRHTIGSLVAIAIDLGVTPLAEGIETEGEHAACLELGFQLGQGYLYGRPSATI